MVWEYEPKDLYYRRMATRFANQARKKVFSDFSEKVVGGYGGNTSPRYNPIFDNQLIRPKDIDAVVSKPKKKDGGDFFGIGGSVGKVLSAPFLGDVDQPWDLLRPVQRVLDAEQRYISGPIAKQAFQAGPITKGLGLDYDVNESIPSWARIGTESLFSPSTWIGPGAIKAIGKPLMKVTAPVLAETFLSSGSRRAMLASLIPNVAAGYGAGVGMEVARELGAPEFAGGLIGGGLAGGAGVRASRALTKRGPVVHVIAPMDEKVFHGTAEEFEGLPKPSTELTKKYSISITGAIYAAATPELANQFTGSFFDQASRNARVIPMVVKRGTKYWDPDKDEWPDLGEVEPPPFTSFLNEMKEKFGSGKPSEHKRVNLKSGYGLSEVPYEIWTEGMGTPSNPLKYFAEDKTYGSIFESESLEALAHNLGMDLGIEGAGVPRTTGELVPTLQQEWKSMMGVGVEPHMETAFFDLVGVMGAGVRERFLNSLKAKGYKAAKTGNEWVILDESILEPLYQEGRSGMLAAIDPSGPEMQRILKTEEDALLSMNKKQRPQSYKRKLQQSLFMKDFTKKVEAGETPTAKELERANAILEKHGKTLDKGGPGTLLASSERLDDFFKKYNEFVYTSGKDYLGVRTPGELDAMAWEHRNLLSKGRNMVGTWSKLPGWVDRAATALGVRLRDTEITPVLNEYRRFNYLGFNYGNKAADTVRGVISRPGSAIKTRYIKEADGTAATMVQDDLLRDEAIGLGLATPEGNLDLDVLIRNADSFTKLSPAQKATIQVMMEPLRQIDELAKSLGIKTRGQEVPSYAHYEELSRPSGTGRLRAPVNRPQFGTKTTATKPEVNLGAGVEKLPFEEAQGQYVTNVLKEISDEWLKGVLDDFGVKPSALIDPAITERLSRYSRIAGQIKWFEHELTRAETRKGTFSSPRFEVAKELERAHEAALAANKLGKAVDRKAAIAKIREDLKNVREVVVDPEITRASAERKKALLEAKRSVDRPDEFQGKLYEEGIGEELNRTVGFRSPPQGIEALMDVVNSNIRPIMATLDLSFTGVQGLIAAFTNPVAFVKAWRTAVIGGWDDYVHARVASGLVDDFILNGGHWAARNDMAEFIFPRGLATKPLVGPLAQWSNTTFTNFGNVLRMELYDAGLGTLYTAEHGLGKLSEAKQELARTVGLVSGFNPHDPSSVEKAMLFAPRFFRAQLGLLSDAVTKNRISTRSAGRYMGQFLGTAVTLTYLAKEFLPGQTDWDWTDIDDPNWMTIRIGGRDISLLGSFQTLAKAVAKGPLEGPAYLGRVKASPAITKMFDIIEGETLGGKEIDASSPMAILKSAYELGIGSNLPISVQNAINDFEPTPQGIGGTATEFLGIKSNPLTEGERMGIRRDKLAQEHFRKDWDDLEPSQKVDLQEQYDLDIESTSELGKAFDLRQAIGERFRGKQEQIDTQLTGQQWIEAYHELNNERKGAFGQWSESHPEAAAKIRSGKAKNPLEAKRLEYFQLFDKADKEGWSPSELSLRLAEFENNLSPQEQDYIQRNSGLKDSPKVKEYKAAQKVLSPYWNLEDKIWERLNQRLPQGEQYASLQDWMNATIADMQDKGVPDSVIARRVQENPVVKQMNNAVRTLRLRYRRAHPEVDRELVKWYGRQPIRGRAS